MSEEKKQFRCQYKTIGLTFSQCEKSREDIMNAIIEKSTYGIGDYYVAQETHKDGNHHLHIWLEFTEKPNIKTNTYFDVLGHHPNIGNKKRNWIYNYLKKQDKTPYTNIPTGFIQLAIEGKLQEATSQFIDMHPKDYAINKERIDRNLSSLGKRKRKEHIYPLTSDYDPEWDPDEKSLHLEGESGSGKTEWAKSYVTHKLQKTFHRVTHLDGLKKYNGEDIIIWDDLEFTHIPRTSAIHIAEVKNARDIHCRHSVASIPPGVSNIFLSNNSYIWPRDDYGAIERRVLHRAPSIRFY